MLVFFTCMSVSTVQQRNLVFYLRLVLVCGVSLIIKALKICLFCSQRFAHGVRWQRDCTIGTWQSATPRTLSALPSPLCGASRVGGARELVVLNSAILNSAILNSAILNSAILNSAILNFRSVELRNIESRNIESRNIV
jgi:hypothetical protein